MRKEKPRVLVVDDEPRYVYAIEYNLEARGYQVLTAGDGRTAIRLVCSEAIDLVILDVKMPDLDGFEVCRRIREFSQVPIIMLTALAEDADRARGLALGASEYVTKPFGVAELLVAVESALRGG